jgi:hypothetical protein
MEVKKGQIPMLKLLFALPLITLALFTNTLIPSMTTVTFQPDTTLTQVIELLNANNSWPHHGNFVTTNGSGFLYKQNGASIHEREYAVWVAQLTFAELNQETPDPAIVACVAANNCPDITIKQITLINPSVTLLDAPIVAQSHAQREVHPFFRENLRLGHP